MLRPFTALLIFALLSSGIARASDSDEEAVSGSHSQHVVAEGDEAQPESGTSADGVEHCCHGCVFPIAVPTATLDVRYDAYHHRVGYGPAIFVSRSDPPLLEPPSA